MTPMELCATMCEGMPALFECSPAPMEGVRVRTPMMYPDGSIVDAFVLERGGAYVITDFGATLSWLRMQSARGSITSRQHGMIGDICRTLGAELSNGQLLVRCAAGTGLADAVLLLSQAAVRVSDIWFTSSSYAAGATGMSVATSMSVSPAARDIASEVNNWLGERRLQVKRGVKYPGQSSREWSVDYEISADARTSLVFLLSASSRTKAQRLAEHVLTGCFDLSYLKDSPGKFTLISLFDDRRDVWQEEDFTLVGGHSQIARWSRPEEFQRLLTAA